MNEDDRLLIQSLRYITPPSGDLLERIDALNATRPELAPYVENLFSLNGQSSNDPFYEIRLHGDAPRNSLQSYRHTEGISLMRMPLARMMDFVCDFLSSYNETIQDRNRIVTGYEAVEYEHILFPYLVAAVIAGYAPNSTFGADVSYHLGVFSFSFRNRLRPSLIQQDFLDAIVKDPYFEVLALGLNIIDKKEFYKAFENKRMRYIPEKDGNFVIIQFFKDYPAKEDALKDRVCFFIEWTGGASRKEVANYFKKSDRTINNVLAELIRSGKIKRVGSRNSPQARYLIIN